MHRNAESLTCWPPDPEDVAVGGFLALDEERLSRDVELQVPGMTVTVVGVDGYGSPSSAGATGRRCKVRGDWVAARRLSSALHSGAADNFLSAVFEIDTTGRCRAVALALIGEVSTLADRAHAPAAQD